MCGNKVLSNYDDVGKIGGSETEKSQQFERPTKLENVNISANNGRTVTKQVSLIYM